MGRGWGFVGCVVVFWGVRVVVVAEGGHLDSVFLDLFDGVVFCMNLLGCLVRRALGNCLGIEFGMLIRKRVALRGLERL